jgi:molecular chaperone GrpE
MTEDNTTNWDEALQDLVDGAVPPAPAEAADQPAGEPASAGSPTPPTAEELVAERTADLQRLQAEYANYKKRVDRDRALARQGGIEAVMADLLPVLDGIAAARSHDELTGGAKLIADELEKVAAKYGLAAFGAADEPFDPHVHEALMTIDKPGYPVTSVAQVFQSGYKLNDRVLRPARVGVAEPSEPVTPEDAAQAAADDGAQVPAGDAPQAAADVTEAAQPADHVTHKPPKPPKGPAGHPTHHSHAADSE